jgi:ADP-dependent NAD(P)H-hydrate dehydratase
MIGGSRGMAGAIAMAGMAAARTGAGLVRLAVPDCCLETVAGFSPCPMLLPLPCDSTGRIVDFSDDLQHWLPRSTCIALGPGMGRSNSIRTFVHELLDRSGQVNPTCPLVIDADGLFALGDQHQWPEQILSPLIITPHPGEWSRICGVPAEDRRGQEDAAVDLAARRGCIVLLKGHSTLVTDGSLCLRNETGTPAMAIGGSGDVLTGVITALICQGLQPFQAARLAAHVHGLAGEIAARRLNSHVVLPTELIEFLPAAFSELAGNRQV